MLLWIVEFHILKKSIKNFQPASSIARKIATYNHSIHFGFEFSFAPRALHLPVHGLGKPVEDGPSTWAPAIPWRPDGAPDSLAWHSLSDYGHLVSGPEDGRSLSIPFL